MKQYRLDRHLIDGCMMNRWVNDGWVDRWRGGKMDGWLDGWLGEERLMGAAMLTR